MQEVKRSTVFSLAGTVLMQVFLSALFSFFFFYLLISFVDGKPASTASSIFSFLFICWICGSSGKNAAEKDHNMVLYNRQKPLLIKGFLSGLLAQIPGLCLLLGFFLFHNDVCGIIYRILYYSSIAFLNTETPNLLLYLAALLPFPLACGVGYLLGYYGAEKLTKLSK